MSVNYCTEGRLTLRGGSLRRLRLLGEAGERRSAWIIRETRTSDCNDLWNTICQREGARCTALLNMSDCHSIELLLLTHHDRRDSVEYAVNVNV